MSIQVTPLLLSTSPIVCRQTASAKDRRAFTSSH